MALEIQNLSADALQRHIIAFEESEITLTLRFYPAVKMWAFDASYKDWSVQGQKLSLGVLHIRSSNQAFDFWVVDTSGTRLDPYLIDDFSTGRCKLIMFDADDMLELRGGPVPL